MIRFIFSSLLNLLWIGVLCQGTWDPPGADKSHPRTLVDSSGLEVVRERLAVPEINALYQSVWEYVHLPVPEGNTTDGERITRAQMAREAAFVVLMNRKPVSGAIVPLTPEERDFLIDRSRMLLESQNTHVGFQEGWVFYQEWQHRSRELINYLIAWDLLRGAALSPDTLQLASDSLVKFTANLYRRAMGTYQVLFLQLRFFDFQFNNHSIMTASALGMAGVVLSDHGSSDPNEQPVNWINAGMWNLDNTLWVEAAPYPRVSEPDRLAGFAEGPAYFDYAFQNGYPFMLAMRNFLPDSLYDFTFSGETRTIPNPWYDSRYDRFGDWINRIRMADGTLPAIHDSPIGFGTSITALTGKPGYNRLYPNFSAGGPMTRTQYIAVFNGHGNSNDSLFQPLPDAGSLLFRSGRDTSATCWHFIGKHDIPLTGAKSHHQGDATSFSLMAHGQLLAIDPGYPGAEFSDAVNKPTDHNLILVNGNGPLPPNGEFVSTQSNTATIENCFDGRHLDYGEVRSAYHGASVTRKALFIGHRYGLLADHIRSGAPSTFTFQLHGNGLYNAPPDSTTGTFVPQFEEHAAKWIRGAVNLQTTVLTSAPNPQYRFATDSMAIGSNLYRHYTKLELSHETASNEALFLTALVPNLGEELPVTTLNMPEGTLAMRVNRPSATDLVLTQEGSRFRLLEPAVSGLANAFGGNGLLSLVSEGSMGTPVALLLQQGDTLYYGESVYLSADRPVTLLYEPSAAGGGCGHIEGAAVIGLFSNQPLRTSSKNISAISYDPAKRINTITFTEGGGFCLELSNNIPSFAPPANALTAYPNPASDGQFTIAFRSAGASIGELTVTDLTGRVIYRRQLTLQNGENSFRVSLPNTAPGQVHVTIRLEDLQYHTTVVVE